MVRCTAFLTTLVLVASASARNQSTDNQTLVITRDGSRAVERAPEANFTGDVRIERLFEAVDPSHSSGGFVTFAPGARTAWHSHPAGQILIVTAGTGRVQLWGQPIEEIRAGDVVRIPAGVKHWHGASPQRVDDTSRNHRGPRRCGSAVDGEGDRRAIQRRGARPRSRATPGRRVNCSSGSRPAWRRSPTTCCTATCGNGPSCRRATAAW